VQPRREADDRYSFDVAFSALPLLPGHYRLRAHAMDPEGMRVFDLHEVPFVIAGSTRELGFCRLPHRWSGE
jgi:lipopolysaccharide transport system ATP-binding protein